MTVDVPYFKGAEKKALKVAASEAALNEELPHSIRGLARQIAVFSDHMNPMIQDGRTPPSVFANMIPGEKSWAAINDLMPALEELAEKHNVDVSAVVEAFNGLNTQEAAKGAAR